MTQAGTWYAIATSGGSQEPNYRFADRIDRRRVANGKRIGRRASDHWGLHDGSYRVVDLLDCSAELGCNWFAYMRRIPQSLGLRAR